MKKEGIGIKKRLKNTILTTLTTLSLLTPTTKAHWHYPARYRVRYSPYAHGLVSSDLRYSPYAFSHENPSGLVPDWFHYSPHAFSPQNSSGLVSDVGYYPFYVVPSQDNLINYIIYSHPYNIAPIIKSKSPIVNKNIESNFEERKKHEEELKNRKVRLEQQINQRKEIKTIIENDSARMLYNILKEKEFGMENILNIRNKIISANFVNRNKKILIKYSNMQEIAILEGLNKTVYEKYMENLKNSLGEYKKQEWKIGEIKNSLEGIVTSSIQN